MQSLSLTMFVGYVGWVPSKYTVPVIQLGRRAAMVFTHQPADHLNKTSQRIYSTAFVTVQHGNVRSVQGTGSWGRKHLLVDNASA